MIVIIINLSLPTTLLTSLHVAGRLDKCVFCPIPTLTDREEILQVLSQDVEAGEDVDWSEVAARTNDFTGADLQSLLSTAQVLVAQEVLGESLYEGVISSGQSPPQAEKEEFDNQVQSQPQLNLAHSGSWESNGDLVKIDESEITETCGTDSAMHLKNKNSQMEVIVETNKIKCIQERGSSQESTSEEESDDFEKLEDCHVVDLTLRTGSVCLTSANPMPADNQVQNTDFKIYRRHIETALLEVKPSVTVAEIQRYERLYATFTKSREGNFGQPSPGKRATLA